MCPSKSSSNSSNGAEDPVLTARRANLDREGDFNSGLFKLGVGVACYTGFRTGHPPVSWGKSLNFGVGVYHNSILFVPDPDNLASSSLYSIA